MTEHHGTPSLQATEDESAQVQKPGTQRASKESIEARISRVEYFQSPLLPHKTHCEILLDNGFVAHGASAPADPANFNPEFGRKLAYDNAFRELWPLFGFLICEKKRLSYLEAPWGCDDYGTPLSGPSEYAHAVPDVQGAPVSADYVPPVWRDRK